MTAPICPVMSGRWDGSPETAGCYVPCQGSACAWWVPYVWGEETCVNGNKELKVYDTGKGTCARNPSGEPFPDPAGEGDR